MEAKILINLKSFCKVSDFTAFMSTFAKIFKCIWQMDVSELYDEENLLVQMQDRWENYGSPDGIADTHDPFDLAGVPRFELYEKINSLLNHALTADENLLLRQTLGMGCKQRSVKNLAQQMGTTQQAVQKQLVVIVEKLRHHDDSIGLWKYLNR